MSIPSEILPPFQGNILRETEVAALTHTSRTHRHRLIKAGLFPAPVKLTPLGRSSGWIEDEVRQYLADRIAASRNGSN